MAPSPTDGMERMLNGSLKRDTSSLNGPQLRQLYRAGLLAILLIAVIVGAGGAALQYSANWVLHTREVLRTIRELQVVLLQAESQALQVVSTTRPLRESPSIDASVDARLDPTLAAPTLRRLIDLTEDNPVQRARADSIASLVSKWMAERRALASGNIAAAAPQTASELLALLTQFQSEEARLYDQRVARQQLWRAILIGGVMAALVLVAFALHRMTRSVLRESHQRRATELERDRAQELLAFALDRSPLGVAVVAADQSLLVSNAAWQELNDRMDGTLLSALRPVVAQVKETGTAHVAEWLVTLAPANPTEAVEVREYSESAVWQAETHRLLAVSAQPVEGSEAAVGLVLMDMTEQRWLETQLRHAQRMESLGRLAGGVAHDINNVVTAIIGFTEMAIIGSQRGRDDVDETALPRGPALPATQVELDLQQVRRAADRAAMMARQLLAFSRQSVARRRPIDIAEVMRDLEPMLRRILGSHVVLRFSYDDERWAVSADPGLIEQVVLNLTINARDAMERGGSLDVDVRAVPQAGVGTVAGRLAWQATRFESDAVAISVRDTGSGMSIGTQQRIFDAFFTTKAEGKGTGLGLATVRQIVDELGGYLLIDSELGRGTTMTVMLPRGEGEPEPLRVTNGKRRVARRQASLLVVEDDRDVRFLAEYVLGDAGYVVQTARNGAEALSALERTSEGFDLLVTDLVMPDVGGVALGKHPIVEQRVRRVLYLSGYPADALGAQTDRPAESDFLAKPFSPHELLEAVDEALAKTREFT